MRRDCSLLLVALLHVVFPQMSSATPKSGNLREVRDREARDRVDRMFPNASDVSVLREVRDRAHEQHEEQRVFEGDGTSTIITTVRGKVANVTMQNSTLRLH